MSSSVNRARALPMLPSLNTFTTSLFAGVIVGAITLFFEISLAVLIFSGDLSAFAAQGISFAIIGAVIMGVIVALGSSLSGVIAIPQDNTAAVLALIAVSISSAMPAALPEERFMTVVAAIIIAGIITGLSLLLLGVFKLGNLTRFIPYPVIGGILAGTGWLLLRGGFTVMTGVNFSLDALAMLFAADMMILWMPGLVYAVLLFWATRRFRHYLIIPGLTTLAAAGFYAWLGASGIARETAAAMGLLLQPFSADSGWQPLNLTMFGSVNWPVLAAQVGGLLTIPFMSVISLLLNAAGIELDGKEDADLNKELVVTGLANLATGAASGLVGYHGLSFTLLARRMAPPRRMVGVLVAAFGLIVLLMGTSVLSLIPVPLLGGLLVYLGLSLLAEWAYDTWRWLSRADYLIVWLILILIAAVGFLEGVGVGIIVTVVLFAAKYSRISVVKYELSGSRYRSNLDRPMKQNHILSEKGDQVYILRLQGFIFFGTAHNLYNMVRARIHDPEPLRYILLDFRMVTGIDSSAILSFSKILQYINRHAVTLVCTQMADQIRAQLENNSYLNAADAQLQIFPDLDYGLEWCEDRILGDDAISLDGKPYTLEAFLMAVLPKSCQKSDLMKYFTWREVAAGESIIQYGTQADDLFFIESGRVTAYLDAEDGRRLRLRTMGAGTVVGEIGMYLGHLRTASVVADQPSAIYQLTAAALRKMEAEDPEIAAAFNRFMVQLLAERLYHTDNALRLLLE